MKNNKRKQLNNPADIIAATSKAIKKHGKVWGALISTLSFLATLAIIILPIILTGKQTRKNSETKGKEDRATIEKQGYEDRKTIELKIEQEKKKEEKRQEVIHEIWQKREYLRAGYKSKLSGQNHLQKMEELRLKNELKGRSWKERTGNSNIDEELKSFDEALYGQNNEKEVKQLGLPFCHAGYDLGWLGLTGGGKTTLVFQLCYFLALGIKPRWMYPKWKCDGRIPILYFALEQIPAELKQYYDKNEELSKTFFLEIGALDPKTVIKKIKKFKKRFQYQDVIVVIDNYKKLFGRQSKEAENFERELNQIRREYNLATMAVWKLLHVDPTLYKPNKPIDPSMALNTKTFYPLCQEFIIIDQLPGSKSNFRYLKPDKIKIGPAINKYPLFYYLEEDHSYLFCGDHTEDVIRTLDKTKIIPIVDFGNSTNGPGRPRYNNLSDEDIVFLYYCNKDETDKTDAIEQAGKPWKSIYTDAQRVLKRWKDSMQNP